MGEGEVKGTLSEIFIKRQNFPTCKPKGLLLADSYQMDTHSMEITPVSVYLFVDLAGNLLCVGCAYLVFLSSLFHQHIHPILGYCD